MMKVIIIVFKIYYLDYQCFIVINHNIGLKFFLLKMKRKSTNKCVMLHV